MGFLKKIRNNILNQQNSFHVGFGNRSPFSYRGKYSGDWTPEVPNLETSAYGQPETDLGETKLLKAQMDTIGKVSDAVTGVAKAYIKKEAKDKQDEQYSKAFQKIGERSEEYGIEYEPSVPIDKMMPTTSTNNPYPNLYPDTPTKTTQDIKNDFNQKKCRFENGTWDSTTNSCK
jgi:hypothetical protein